MQPICQTNVNFCQTNVNFCPTSVNSRTRLMEMVEESYSPSEIKLNTKSTLPLCGKRRVGVAKIVGVATSCAAPETCISRIKNYVRENPIKSIAIGVAGLAMAVGAGFGIYQAIESTNEADSARAKRDVAQDLSETTEIETLHQASVLDAVSDLNGTNFRTALTRIEFEDQACQRTLLSSIFNGTDSSEVLAENSYENPNIVWSSTESGRPVTSAKLNREQFSRALAYSANHPECLLRMSAEPLLTRKMIAEIRRNAALRDIQQKIEAIQHQASGRGDQYCVEIVGDKLGERRVECREPYVASVHRNSTDIAADLEAKIDTSDACVARIAIISDGIRQGTVAAENVVSTIRFNQTQTTAQPDLSHISSMSSHEGSYPMNAPMLRSPTNQTISEIFADSVVRRCPNIRIDDYRAAVGIKARNDSDVVASVLSAEYAIQALDHIQQLASERKPEAAILIEPDPMPDSYLPDVLLAGDYIDKLAEEGTRVITLDSYDGSWVSQIPYIVHESDTSSAVAKLQNFSLLPKHKAEKLTTEKQENILLGAQFIAASALVGASVYACTKQRRNPARETATEYEMQPMHQEQTE